MWRLKRLLLFLIRVFILIVSMEDFVDQIGDLVVDYSHLLIRNQLHFKKLKKVKKSLKNIQNNAKTRLKYSMNPILITSDEEAF